MLAIGPTISKYIKPHRFIGVGERKGVERPASVPMTSARGFMPVRSSGLFGGRLDAVVRHLSLQIGRRREPTLIAARWRLRQERTNRAFAVVHCLG